MCLQREKAKRTQINLIYKAGSISKVAFHDSKLSVNLNILTNRFNEVFIVSNNILIYLNICIVSLNLQMEIAVIGRDPMLNCLSVDVFKQLHIPEEDISGLENCIALHHRKQCCS